MKTILQLLANELVFWMAWIIIPIVMEIVPAIGGFSILMYKKIKAKKGKEIARLPEITLIIPVYNSSDSLYECLQSVDQSTYPNELISIILVNNCSTDDSFEIYKQSQNEFVTLSMQWLNAEQGKSKALNMALYNSDGKYVIHIDSDGKLEKSALQNIVMKFENNPSIDCLTGSVVTDYHAIEKTENSFFRLFRKIEFFEYCQAFLAGRNFESELDSIYTLSGAFSAFRKSTILKTQLYNPDTVCEDTHVTFQVRRMLNKSVHLCEDAIFFVDPIEDFNKLYTQRQRWQRGEIEVNNLFYRRSKGQKRNKTKSILAKVLLYDHTFAFPRMIWYFALICLATLNYPMKLIVGSVVVIYALYVLSTFLYYLNIAMFLGEFKELKSYYLKKWYLVFILPIYNFVIFWIRFAGIINSINTDSAWKTKTLTEEKEAFQKTIASDFSFFTRLIVKLRKSVNNDRN